MQKKKKKTRYGTRTDDNMCCNIVYYTLDRNQSPIGVGRLQIVV